MGSFTVRLERNFRKPGGAVDLAVFTGAKRYVTEEQAGRHLGKCVRYARENHAYVVTDRFVARHRLCLALFSPEGEPVGIQCAVNLNRSYTGELRADHSVKLFETPMGRLALCVDADINRPEYARRARMLGADILVSSQYIDAYDYSAARAWAGEWNQAQANSMVVINVSNLLCSVCAPCALTEDRSGFLLPVSKFPAKATVDCAPLAELDGPMRTRYPDRVFCRKHFIKEKSKFGAMIPEARTRTIEIDLKELQELEEHEGLL